MGGLSPSWRCCGDEPGPAERPLPPQDDEFTHLYTLIVRPDNTYEVKIDNSKVESGSLEDDWDFLPPKKIKDPEAKKPEDWDERAKIDDPEDSKPEVGGTQGAGEGLGGGCGRTLTPLFIAPPSPGLGQA